MWFLGFVAAAMIAISLVRYYAEPKTPLFINCIVAFSWALGFSYFLVLPFDIAGAMCESCKVGDPTGESCSCFPSPGLEMLSDLIPVCYYITMLCGYLMNDLLRSYVDSGEFTLRGKIRDALMDAAIFYVPAIVIGLFFLIIIYAQHPMDFETLKALGRGLINSVCLLFLICFIGYGFVEVPRHLMNKANTDGQLRYAKFRVAVQSEAFQSARRKLEETLELVHSTDAQMRNGRHSELHEHMAHIMRRVPRNGSSGGCGGAGSTQPMRPAQSGASITPPDEESGGGARPAALAAISGLWGGKKSSTPRSGGSSSSEQSKQTVVDEKLLPTTRKGLVALNLRLKRAVSSEKRQRSMYELEVRRGLRLQALYEPNGASGAPISSTMVRGGPSSGDDEQPSWKRLAKPWFYRVSSILCGTLSVILIWCEGTILFDDPPFNLNLSPISYFFRAVGANGGGLMVILLLYVPLLYCAACTYFAMFQLKLCDAITLHPNRHTDGSALLFHATYACRLGPPLCFNYLKLLHEQFDPDIGRHGHGALGLLVHPRNIQKSQQITTYFTSTIFGHMQDLPIFNQKGDYFNNYAPLVRAHCPFGLSAFFLSHPLSSPPLSPCVVLLLSLSLSSCDTTPAHRDLRRLHAPQPMLGPHRLLRKVLLVHGQPRDLLLRRGLLGHAHRPRRADPPAREASAHRRRAARHQSQPALGRDER